MNKELTNLLTKSNEEAVKEFVAWLKLSSDVFYHEPSLQSLLTKEMETYLQSLDGERLHYGKRKTAY